MAKTTDVALADDAAMTDIILGKTEIPEQDTAEVTEAIVRRIMAAESVQDVFREDSSIATKELVGTTLTVNQVGLRPSLLGDGDGVYMLIDAVRHDTGEIVLVNTGSAKIMAQLGRCHQRGWLPVTVEVIEVGEAKPGQSAPLGLRHVGDTDTEALKR